MDFKTFKLLVKGIIPVGTVLQNPGGGTSIIKSLTDSNVTYIRGKTPITASFKALFCAYDNFKGKEVSTSDLKSHKPSVYDSENSGHSCHCTFLFMILCRLPLVVGIKGRGLPNSPFYIHIPK